MAGRREIHVVEDDPATVSFIEAAVHGGVDPDLPVVHLDRVAGAAERVIGARPALLLCDLGLPDGSGLEVIREVRAVLGSPMLPILVLTGDPSAEALDEAFTAGASDVIRKPVGFHELTHRLEVHLRAHDLQRQLEDRLEQRSRQVIGLDQVLDALHVMVWVVTPDGHVTLTNRGAGTPDGHNVWGLVQAQVDLHAAERVSHHRLVVDTLAGDVAYDVVVQRLGPDATVVAAYEATARSRATLALEEALESARRTRDMRTRFLTSISHELRSPLTVIGGALDLALRLPLEERLADLLQAAKGQQTRLQDLILDLLLVAEDSVSSLSRRPTRLTDVMADAVRRCGAQSDRVHIVGSEAIVVDADRDRLARAVAAIVDNALRFSPRGSPVRVALDAHRDGATVTVEDAGPGIPPDAREEVFEPFSRAQAEVGHAPGVGVGLTVARLLVQAHGGDITIGDAADLGGARVTILLDVTTAAGHAARPRDADRATLTGSS